MSSFTVAIDDAIIERVSPERVAEWRALAEDLAEAVRSLDGRSGRWRIAMDGNRFTIASDGEQVTIDRAELDSLFEEYLDVVQRLGSTDEGGFSRMDALDMAKKVTHDRAGRVLKRHLRPLRADHEVARRVFSLLAALAHDTSGLAHVHAALAKPNGPNG